MQPDTIRSDILRRAARDDPRLLHINMFGGCSLTYGQNEINDQIIRSKKPWLLLEYLIAFRTRDLSQNDLVEAIYPEGRSENPVNALKTLVHRIRAMLDELGFADSKDMVMQSRGVYKWNCSMRFDVDTDLFDELYVYATNPSVPAEHALAALLRAIELYQGDLLPKTAMESWVIRLGAHYHGRFLDAVARACMLLKESGRHEEIVTICRHAIEIDSFEETLYSNLIQALIALGRHQSALTVYKDMTNLFYREFGVTPSEHLTSLYRDIIKSIHVVETDLSVIKEKLREETEEDGAFFCEIEVFKDIYRLEVRAAARTGESVYLCLLTLSSQHDAAPPPKIMSNNMDRLAGSIRSSLRRGDVFAKYSVSQFLLLLPATSYESCEMVLSRIVRRFKKDAPTCPLQASFSIQPIDMSLA